MDKLFRFKDVSLFVVDHCFWMAIRSRNAAQLVINTADLSSKIWLLSLSLACEHQARHLLTMLPAPWPNTWAWEL